MHLIVVHPFGEYSRGDAIVDPAIIAEILASDNAACVVSVASVKE